MDRFYAENDKPVVELSKAGSILTKGVTYEIGIPPTYIKSMQNAHSGEHLAGTGEVEFPSVRGAVKPSKSKARRERTVRKIKGLPKEY